MCLVFNKQHTILGSTGSFHFFPNKVEEKVVWYYLLWLRDSTQQVITATTCTLLLPATYVGREMSSEGRWLALVLRCGHDSQLSQNSLSPLVLSSPCSTLWWCTIIHGLLERLSMCALQPHSAAGTLRGSCSKAHTKQLITHQLLAKHLINNKIKVESLLWSSSQFKYDELIQDCTKYLMSEQDMK